MNHHHETGDDDDDGHHDDDHAHHQPGAPGAGACDSSASTSTTSWEPDSQYEEDLVMMTQKCPVFAQQQQQQLQQQQEKNASSGNAAPRTISFSCPFKDQQVAATAEETLLKIPPSHYEMGEFVRVMEGTYQLFSIQQTPAKMPPRYILFFLLRLRSNFLMHLLLSFFL
jgi:hypothetical protein